MTSKHEIMNGRWVFIECDFPQLELYTLAQCCMTWFGYSKLGEALIACKDPHLLLAAGMLRLSYDDALTIFNDKTHVLHSKVKKLRQQAKPGNFGFGGMMGIDTFLKTQRKQLGRKEFNKLGLDEKVVKDIKEGWFEAWPEMRPYKARVEQIINECESGRAQVESLFSGLVRGNTTYCGVANHGFQALGALCAKRAAWLIAEACYVNEESPLYNSRANGFIHDEFIGETPWRPNAKGYDPKAAAAAGEMKRLMCKGANEFLPNVPMAEARLEEVMMFRWYKAATSLYMDTTTGTFSGKPGPGLVLVPGKVVKQGDASVTVFDDGLVASVAA